MQLTSSLSQDELFQGDLDRYRQIVDESGGLIYRISPDGHFTFVNPTAARIVQKSAEDCIGLHFLTLIRPDHRERAADFYLQQVHQRKELTYFEFPALASDGTEIWIGQTVQLVIDGGKVIELQCQGRDITSRKKMEQQLVESEQRYRLLFEANPHPMWVYDCETLKFLTVNEAAIITYGYSNAEFLAMTMLDIQQVSEAQPNDRVANCKMCQHLTKSGARIDVEVATLPLTFADRPAKLVTATDITARLKAEAEGRIILEQLRQSQKMEAIGMLAGGVAHDFNNLLTAISGYAELALRFQPTNQIKRNLEEIRKASSRATGLTKQLLAFSRKQILQVNVFDLNAAVSDMETMLHRLIGENIILRTVLGTDLKAVNADQGQIEQVIMNLVVNARDALADFGEITIETKNVRLDEANLETSSGQPFVMLSVTDNGIGMDAATKDKVFDPFFTTKGAGKGTGLGLSTVYGIVEQSGGRIEVVSEPGCGSAFKIYLPSAEQPSSVMPGKQQTATPRGAETILLAEDEPMVRTMTRHILELSGYKVLEAATGTEAVEICGTQPECIDLLLTDVVMPQMNGPKLKEAVTKLRPAIKTIFMSGYSDNTIVDVGIVKAEVPFLQKPFSPDALVRKVRSVLDEAS